MADVFLSYKRQDEAAVGRLVKALREEGLSVWWDRDIPPDAPWEDTIEREHAAAKALVVCWSKAAVASENVKAEARRAKAQNRIVQTFLEPCEPPMFFGERQGVDLTGWTGKRDDPRFRNVVEAVRAILEGRTPAVGVGLGAPSKRKLPVAAIVGGLAVLAVIAGVAAWGAMSGQEPAATPRETLQQVAAQQQRRQQQAEAELLRRIQGSWGIQMYGAEQACTPRYRLQYVVTQDPQSGVRRLVVTGANNHRGEGEIIRIAGGVIETSAILPVGDAGRLVETSLDGDKLVIRDRRLTERIELTRCPDAPP